MKSKQKRFIVSIERFTFYKTRTIEAKTMQAAKNLAEQMADNGDLEISRVATDIYASELN